MVKRSDYKEDDRDQASRKRLVTFLDVTERVLNETMQQLSRRTIERYRESLDYLETLRQDAFAKLGNTRELMSIGLKKGQRRALAEVGLFHEALLAKLRFLWDCIGDGTIAPILKALNNILGSLAKIVSIIHAVKEFKEWIEIAIDRLGPASDPIVLNLGTLPSL